MKLVELISCVDNILRIEGDREVDIRGLSHHSKRVKPGDLFVCIKGLKTDGHLYIEESITNGAVAIVMENWTEIASPVTRILVPNSRKALAHLSHIFYGRPSSRLTLVGITGTNGKTTTAHLVESILTEAGYKVGLLGTIQYKIGERIFPVERTTPESCDLQKILGEMVREHVDVGVMEVTSHAIDLHRTDHCQFDVLVFTNLSQDHLDYHQNMEEYFRVKSELFRSNDASCHIVNIDDPYGRRIAEISHSEENYLYGLGPLANIKASRVRLSDKGTRFKVLSSGIDCDFSMCLLGLFNVYNTLAAISTSLSLRLPLRVIRTGIGKVKGIPGRFEIIDCGQKFTVVVDYAHTPDSLDKVISTAREITKGKVITVFGCGGDRDRLKRPLMGAVSSRLSDYTIITSDNPRSEDPGEIIDQIEKGIKRETSEKYCKIMDRREAIYRAISLANEGDTVIIAGKGHEVGQIFADKTIPFDDRLVAHEILRELRRCSH
ncbi:MAG: UDP-N-acetylmuramoyl-L-alanyl-D-glutamate--2,6-diaminopimelate ligase [Actinomycetota bacterium]|nr:UDP-N-acetylmuramoyl-L-alanyl-D-glutamate--2,6-diaminopimelate ligase [Actinomycetota bacterium]